MYNSSCNSGIFLGWSPQLNKQFWRKTRKNHKKHKNSLSDNTRSKEGISCPCTIAVATAAFFWDGSRNSRPQICNSKSWHNQILITVKDFSSLYFHRAVVAWHYTGQRCCYFARQVEPHSLMLVIGVVLSQDSIGKQCEYIHIIHEHGSGQF